MQDISNYLVGPNTGIREAIKVIGRNRDGIAIVADENGFLVGTVTDGDIRRHILADGSFDIPCKIIMSTDPKTAPANYNSQQLISFMQQYRLVNLPVVSDAGKPLSVVHLRDLLTGFGREDRVAVIMAGGEGKRLRPLTDDIPKPMICVGERPLLEENIIALKKSGFTRIFIAVNYRAEVIMNYFGGGEKHGLEIVYLKESKKLGTAGALSLLPELPTGPFVVMNGDVVTKVNLSNLVDFHVSQNSKLTIAATEYRVQVPLGVLEIYENSVIDIKEKPSYRYMCNAGMYVLSPEVLALIPDDEEYDMTKLFMDVKERGFLVSAFPLHEYWVDIGQKNDLEKAREELHKTK